MAVRRCGGRPWWSDSVLPSMRAGLTDGGDKRSPVGLVCENVGGGARKPLCSVPVRVCARRVIGARALRVLGLGAVELARLANA